ncbi:MAG TPA: Fic family protein [Clostridia bacterium]|nr:Fic family protein [Clostridia bacterium]
MDNKFNMIQEILQKRADYNARLNLLPYDGSPEIKEINGKKYIYIRKRIGGRLTSKYVDIYSDELYQLLLRTVKEARDLKKNIRQSDSELANLGYIEKDLSPKVILNLDLARANMKSNIYDQAVLEGVSTTFPQTEDILENGIVNGVSVSDVQKILNLKHAWEFILDKDVISYDSNYHILSHIAKLVNEGFYDDGGRTRNIPVKIGGTSYIPPIPLETMITENIISIIQTDEENIDIAIKLCLYCMKTQIFIDGNKRAAVIFANHYLISKGEGLIVIPEKEVSAFKQILIAYYEGKNNKIHDFMKTKCWIKL